MYSSTANSDPTLSFQTMDDLINSSFNLNLTTLRLLGLYPKKRHSKAYLMYGYVLMFFCLLPDPIFGAIFYLRDEKLTIFDAGLNLFLMVAMISFVPKMLPFVINNEKIRECLYYLELSVKVAVINEKQKKIVEECVSVCRRNSRFFFVFLVLDNISWSCRPFLSPKREFPMEVWLPFDPTTNDLVFYTIYMFLSLGVTYTVLSNAAVDPLISGLAYHAAGQIKILKDNLEFLLEYTEKKVPEHCSEEVKYRCIYQSIKKCTQHHHHILCFVKKLENCFSWAVFSQFLGSTVMICFCCLQLSELKPGSLNFLLMTVYLNSALTQIYFYCYYGTTLFEESNSLTTAAFLGRWYEYDLKSQKALVIFMERAKIPMKVTAGKVLELSLDTFTYVLKKSYSLLAVLENY